MNVYIQTDLEGVAGVVSYEDCTSRTIENFTHRQRIYRLLTGEVSAAVRGCKSAGATTICVNDSHGSGYNILFEELESGCEIIHGRSSTLETWLPFLDASFDALVCIGMHAMTCTPLANMPHSKWVLNGGEVYLSEGSMAAALAGCFNVPLVFVSGDQTVTSEILEKVPETEVGVVKQALSPYAARSLLPREAQRVIEEGVKRGLERRAEIAPYKVPGPPYRLNLLDSPDHATEKLCLEEDVTGDDFLEVFNRTITSFPWCPNRGSQKVDGYRYPENLIP